MVTSLYWLAPCAIVASFFLYGSLTRTWGTLRMGQVPRPPPDFAGYYDHPNIEQMVTGLSDHEFEHFVKYVFEQAGYFVKDTAGKYGQGLDLKLYTGPSSTPSLYAGVSMKHFRHPDMPSPHSLVQAQHIMNLKGALAGLSGHCRLPCHNEQIYRPCACERPTVATGRRSTS
jgi:hypothetical protein